MDLTLSPEYAAFRDQIADTLKANAHLAPGPEDKGLKHPKRLAWQEFLIREGLTARTIPTEYGGYGAEPDILKSRIIAEEFARSGLPRPLAGQGISMLVPTMLEHGTEEQKQRYIRPTIRSQLIWCQGYSEPNAGSDLANLQTMAEDKGSARPPSETATEYQRTLERLFPRNLVRMATGAFNRAIYGHHSASDEQISQIRQSINSIKSAMGFIRGQRPG